MSDQPPPASTTREFTSRIIAAYLRRNPVAADQMPALIMTVHQALAALGTPMQAEPTERTPAVSIRRSVTPDAVFCLECGWKGKMLRRHIGTAHELSVREYRTRWNLPADHLIVAPSYSARRSGLAKELGLGHGRLAARPTADLATSLQQPGTPRRRAARSEQKGEPTEA